MLKETKMTAAEKYMRNLFFFSKNKEKNGIEQKMILPGSTWHKTANLIQLL